MAWLGSALPALKQQWRNIGQRSRSAALPALPACLYKIKAYNAVCSSFKHFLINMVKKSHSVYWLHFILSTRLQKNWLSAILSIHWLQHLHFILPSLYKIIYETSESGTVARFKTFNTNDHQLQYHIFSYVYVPVVFYYTHKDYLQIINSQKSAPPSQLVNSCQPKFSHLSKSGDVCCCWSDEPYHLIILFYNT